MRDLSPSTITQQFADYAKDAPSQRARDLMNGLAAHLHAFVQENRLTHAEWRTALEILTRAGEITTPERNEFVLFSDLLGVSSLVDMINTPPGATSSSVLGPFHRVGAPEAPNGADLWRGQPGEPLVVTGRVEDAASGAGLADAVIDIWQNADNGFYAAQDPDQPEYNYHAVMRPDGQGRFAFTTTRPRPYMVPYDGPAGDMLRALGRDAWRPAHLHFIVRAPGRSPLVTEMFPEDDPYLDTDATFGVRADLVLPLQSTADRGELPEELEHRERLPESFLRSNIVFRLAPES